MEIDILNIEKFRVHQEWRHKKVNSPYSRIYFIIDGRGFININGKEYMLQPGHIYLIPAFTTVDLFCPETFLHYYIHFNAELENGLNIFQIAEFDCQVVAEKKHITKDTFERLIELNPSLELLERDANKPIYQSMLERSQHESEHKTISNIVESNGIMRLLLSAFLSESKEEKQADTAAGIGRIQPALKYIHNNIHHTITLDDLAKIVDLNPAYFSDMFSRVMGISPIKYINKKRVEKAQTLLVSTELTLSQIAQKTGFNDEYYFSRLFCKTVGQSPGKYRRMFRIA